MIVSIEIDQIFKCLLILYNYIDQGNVKYLETLLSYVLNCNN